MKIKFLPQNISIEAVSGKSVMEQAKQHKLPVSSSCNGMCSCAECRVYIVEGESHVLPPTAKEVELIGGAYFLDHRRLSCQLFCFGDVTVDLSEQVERVQHQKGITKQFLKKLHKEEVSSVGGVLVEQDQEIHQLATQDTTDIKVKNTDLSDDFYKTNQRGTDNQHRKRHHRQSRHKIYRKNHR